MGKIGFLGFGNMASAIAGGILKSGLIRETDVVAYDPIRENIDKFSHPIMSSDTALQMAPESKYLFICVKPQMISEALASIVPALTKNHVLVSIAAGVSIERIKKLTDSVCPVVRVMPNTPLLLGCGSTAIAKPDDINEIDYDFVVNVFKCVGTVYEISSDKFNEVIPVNGSSPAFIYLFADIIAKSAKEVGLDYESSLEMFSDTLIGSARMLKESGYSPDELIQMVSSKGGTTVAALEAMKKHGFEDALKEGFSSCVHRAYELGKEN